MKKENVLEVISRLTGEIEPVADSAIDKVRLENLELFIAVFDEMHTIIDDIAWRYRDSSFDSVKPFVDACKKQLEKMGDI